MLPNIAMNEDTTYVYQTLRNLLGKLKYSIVYVYYFIDLVQLSDKIIICT